MRDIKSYSLAQLEEYLLSIGEAKYRAGQIFEWIHKKNIKDIDEMSNISAKLRLKLKEDCTLLNVEEILYKESAIDKTCLLYTSPSPRDSTFLSCLTAIL